MKKVCAVCGCPTNCNNCIADSLIANGVTVQDKMEISDELLEQLRNAPVTVITEEPTIEVVQEWISVKDRLPEDWTDVLVLSEFGFCEVAVYLGSSSNKWRVTWNHDMLEGDVTHWMPLPPAPEDVK